MLSSSEIEKINWQLEQVPKSFEGKQKRNLCRTLRQKLQEHELASSYPQFQPLPHKKFFINNVTQDLTLLHLIEVVQCSKTFILDTESINIPNRPNKPALIQLQVILPNSFSYVILVEVWHLPPERDVTFELIKLFFNTLFQPDKRIFIWGEIEELVDFIKFNLFSYEQIYRTKNINFQNKFKDNWIINHPHTGDSKCLCESCLGINPGDTWSLQLATAYTLNVWLDKRVTRAQFEIGLDPQLKRLNSNELEHRQQLTSYAANDCLSIQQLLIASDYIQYDPNELSPIDNPPTSLYEPTSSNDDNEDDIIADTRIKTNRTISIIIGNNNPKRNLNEYEENSLNKKQRNLINSAENNGLELIPNNLPLTSRTTKERISSEPDINKEVEKNNWNTNLSNTNPLPNVSTIEQQLFEQPSNQLNGSRTRTNITDEEKKKIHNRSRTLKQRERCYKHEIIKQNIDNRFSVTDIKQILKRLNIPVTLVNKYTSRTTNRTTLFIGIRYPENIDMYEQVTEKLFSTDHYYEFAQRNRRRNTQRQSTQRQSPQRHQRQSTERQPPQRHQRQSIQQQDSR